MLFAAAAEAASNGEEQTRKAVVFHQWHDLRSTCARLCHHAGGELDQIQFLLGHVSIQTTERYLGCKQRFHDAVNDHIGLEPDAAS
jgi:integrase